MHAHLKISWINHQTKQKDGTFFTYPPPIFPSPPHTLTSNSHNQTSPNKISPSLLFIIVILAVLFFISGLLHLLVRFLSKKNQPNTNPEPNAQNALQQLFHLHDSGLDQAFIDALPVFAYDEIVGPASEKEPFDCAVCLCEFSDKDTLRLLPACGHAFHMSCIDTWLLSNSTCPLCRGAVFDPDVGPVFEYDEFSESDARSGENGCGSAGKKSVEIEEEVVEVENVEKGVLTVRLGKFRKTDGGDDVGEIKEDESGSSKLGVDDRRCYSMGSYEYVVGDTNLRVALRRDRDKTKRDSGDDGDGRRIGIGSKNDSYSISKIWLWSKGGKIEGSSGEARPGDLSSPNLDLGWMPRREGV